MDASQTITGTGGVGGLLAVAQPSDLEPSTFNWFYPTYDANGNVSEYVDGSGSVVAHYDDGVSFYSLTYHLGKPWLKLVQKRTASISVSVQNMR